MVSMIMGPGTGGVPPCLDGRDNDGDGQVDFEDAGTDRNDPEEVMPMACQRRRR